MVRDALRAGVIRRGLVAEGSGRAEDDDLGAPDASRLGGGDQAFPVGLASTARPDPREPPSRKGDRRAIHWLPSGWRGLYSLGFLRISQEAAAKRRQLLG